MSRAAAVLGALLVLSGLCNAWLAWAYMGQRDDTTKAQADRDAIVMQRDAARSAAAACSAATEALRTLAGQRETDARAARAAAAAAARNHGQRADDIMAKPAAVPGDDCRSAELRVQAWLAERGQP